MSGKKIKTKVGTVLRRVLRSGGTDTEALSAALARAEKKNCKMKELLKAERKASARNAAKEAARAERHLEKMTVRAEYWAAKATGRQVKPVVIRESVKPVASTSLTPPVGGGNDLRYRRLIDEIASLNDARSLSSGRADWAEKWRSCNGKRILYFTISDFSGSFYKWADGINRHTHHAVRMVSLARHRFGYPVDLLYAPPKLIMTEFSDMLNEVARLADEADIIHLKDQLHFSGYSENKNSLPSWLLTQFGKPIIYTLYGGYARRDEAQAWFQRYVSSHAAIVAMTPDLCFDWAEINLVPHSIDTEVYGFEWTDGELMLHTPSRPERKGTEFFEAAGSRLAIERGLSCEIVTGATHNYVMEKKRHATIFFDQAGRERHEHGSKLIGWYGNSALEAAVFGVPTIAHLSEEAQERAARHGLNTAILNTEASMQGLDRVLTDFFDRSPVERADLARRTRDWIEADHSYHSVSMKLSSIYDQL